MGESMGKSAWKIVNLRMGSSLSKIQGLPLHLFRVYGRWLSSAGLEAIWLLRGVLDSFICQGDFGRLGIPPPTPMTHLWCIETLRVEMSWWIWNVMPSCRTLDAPSVPRMRTPCVTRCGAPSPGWLQRSSKVPAMAARRTFGVTAA